MEDILLEHGLERPASRFRGPAPPVHSWASRRGSASRLLGVLGGGRPSRRFARVNGFGNRLTDIRQISGRTTTINRRRWGSLGPETAGRTNYNAVTSGAVPPSQGGDTGSNPVGTTQVIGHLAASHEPVGPLWPRAVPRGRHRGGFLSPPNVQCSTDLLAGPPFFFSSQSSARSSMGGTLWSTRDSSFGWRSVQPGWPSPAELPRTCRSMRATKMASAIVPTTLTAAATCSPRTKASRAASTMARPT